MKAQSTYWVYFKQACEQLIGSDAPTISRVKELVDAIAEAPVAKQHAPISELLSLLGGMERTRELGFVMGRMAPVTAYGGLTLLLRIAPTLRDVLRVVADYHHGETPLLLYGFEDTAEEGRFTIGFRCPIGPSGEALAVSAVATTVRAEALRLTGHPSPFSVELTSSSRGWEALYRKHLGTAPSAVHARNVFIFDRSTLDRPTLTADAESFRWLVAELQRDKIRGSEEGLPRQVEERVMSRIGEPPTVEDMAKSLGCTPRKLRRLLALEGTSYQEIVRRCRVEYAGALLRNPLCSVSDVAFRLGFDELAAFTHNFKRWTGASPSQFRRECERHNAGSAARASPRRRRLPSPDR